MRATSTVGAEYTGSCHCGAIGCTCRSALAPDCRAVRACQCSFCRALDTSDTDGEIVFVASDPDALQKYRFDLSTADFLLCRKCGIYIGAIVESSGVACGIIKLHALRDIAENLSAIAAVSYDAEDAAARVARRVGR